MLICWAKHEYHLKKPKIQLDAIKDVGLTVSAKTLSL